MSDPETIRVYDTRAQDYASVTSSKQPDSALRAFIDALPQGAKVLDLGCGPGHASAHMADRGFVVEAWDASAKMVALADQHPKVAAKQALFSDLATKDAFDGIWANFSLLHAPREELPTHLRAIRRALRSGGLFHIALKEGRGEARDRIGRKYSYYTVETLSDLLQEAGLTPGPFRSGVDVGLDGTPAQWISTTAHA